MIIKVLLAVLMISAVVVAWACIRISAVENERVAAQLEDTKKIGEELRKAIKEERK